MNIPQNLPCAFPFWHTPVLTGSANWIATAQKQTFRHSYCENVPLTEIAIQVRYDRLIPMIAEVGAVPTDVFLCEYDALSYDEALVIGAANITDLMTFDAYTQDGRDFIEFTGNADVNQATAIDVLTQAGLIASTWAGWVRDGGLYYIILQFADETRLYSELIQIVDFPEFPVTPDTCTSRLRIECVNNCPIGDLPSTNFAPHKIFIKDPTSQPTYITEKSVATNGKRQERITWAGVKKRWKVSFNVTEPVADFCSLIPLFSTDSSAILITDTYGVGSEVSDLEVEISWPEELGGCLANVDLFFTRDFTDFENCC
mgnify:FL=1